MNISFENPDKINGLLTITVEEADYKENVEKALNDYRKKANYPGFRPGMVPMGLVKKQIGTSAKMDAINKLIGEQIYKYVNDNKIQMLGDPLPSDKQEPQDLEKGTTFTFVFDIAVAPEFKMVLDGHNKLDHYTITVDDALIDRQIDIRDIGGIARARLSGRARCAAVVWNGNWCAGAGIGSNCCKRAGGEKHCAGECGQAKQILVHDHPPRVG